MLDWVTLANENQVIMRVVVRLGNRQRLLVEFQGKIP